MDCCPCLSVRGSAAYSFASQSEEAHRKGHSLLEIAETEMLSITSHHGPRTFAGVLLIMILCVADSYLTIDLVSRGAEELNPIMAYYLNQSPLLFFIVKYSITSTAIMMILVTGDSSRWGIKIRPAFLLVSFFIALALAVQWQLILIHTVAE